MAVAILGQAVLGEMILGNDGSGIEWKTPKTYWKNTDRFNIVDFNRIKNNLRFLHQKACKLYRNFDIENMGDEVTSYESYWNVAFFNAFETNVDVINNTIYTKDYGISQSFFENGPFIKWDELNRIESACLEMKDILDRQESGLQRLSFRLGGMKGVNV